MYKIGEVVVVRCNQHKWLFGTVKGMSACGVRVKVADELLTVNVPLELLETHLLKMSVFSKYTSLPRLDPMLRMTTIDESGGGKILVKCVRPAHLAHRQLYQKLNCFLCSICKKPLTRFNVVASPWSCQHRAHVECLLFRAQHCSMSSCPSCEENAARQQVASQPTRPRSQVTPTKDDETEHWAKFHCVCGFLGSVPGSGDMVCPDCFRPLHSNIVRGEVSSDFIAQCHNADPGMEFESMLRDSQGTSSLGTFDSQQPDWNGESEAEEATNSSGLQHSHLSPLPNTGSGRLEAVDKSDEDIEPPSYEGYPSGSQDWPPYQNIFAVGFDCSSHYPPHEASFTEDIDDRDIIFQTFQSGSPTYHNSAHYSNNVNSKNINKSGTSPSYHQSPWQDSPSQAPSLHAPSDEDVHNIDQTDVDVFLTPRAQTFEQIDELRNIRMTASYGVVTGIQVDAKKETSRVANSGNLNEREDVDLWSRRDNMMQDTTEDSNQEESVNYATPRASTSSPNFVNHFAAFVNFANSGVVPMQGPQAIGASAWPSTTTEPINRSFSQKQGPLEFGVSARPSTSMEPNLPEREGPTWVTVIKDGKDERRDGKRELERLAKAKELEFS